MRGKRVVVVLALIVLAILVIAWFDGGEESLRPIEQAVPLPDSASGFQNAPEARR